MERSDLVFRYELRRAWGPNGRGRLFRWVLAVVGVGLPVLLALDRWLPPIWTYYVAAYAQAGGLGPPVPPVHPATEIPLWAINTPYLRLSWAVCFTLLLGRIVIAVQTAASIRHDRASSSEEMLTLASLRPSNVLAGKLLAPVVPTAALLTLVVCALSPSALGAGVPSWVPPRIWAEGVLQLLVVAALCRGCALRQRGENVEAAAVTCALVAVTLGLSLYGILINSLITGAAPWSDPGGSFLATWMLADVRLHGLFLAGLGVLGWHLALSGARRADARRPSFAATAGIAATVLLLTAGGVQWSRSHPADGAELDAAQVPHYQAAAEALALHDPRSALRCLERAERAGRHRERLRIMRACAYFDAGDFAQARRECLELRPLKLSLFAVPNYWGGLAACLLAEGQPERARESLEFLSLLIARVVVPPTRSEVPTDGGALARRLSDSLPSASSDPFAPARQVFLRRAVALYPDDPVLREGLRSELLVWAGRAGPKSPAWTALRREAAQTARRWSYGKGR